MMFQIQLTWDVSVWLADNIGSKCVMVILWGPVLLSHLLLHGQQPPHSCISYLLQLWPHPFAGTKPEALWKLHLESLREKNKQSNKCKTIKPPLGFKAAAEVPTLALLKRTIFDQQLDAASCRVALAVQHDIHQAGVFASILLWRFSEKHGARLSHRCRLPFSLHWVAVLHRETLHCFYFIF